MAKKNSDTVKFYEELPKSNTVSNDDKLMIGRGDTGETMYIEVNQLKNSVSREYIHEETVPNTIWTISHPLNKKPTVTILINDMLVMGNVRYQGNSEVVITFNTPQTGEAILR